MSRPRPSTRTSRRAALGLGLVALAGAGCSPEASTSEPPSGTPSGRRTPGPRAGQDEPDASPTADPDTELVALVLTEISRAHAQVRADRRAHRPLAGQLRGLERLHARHAAELGGLVEVPALTIRAEPRRDRVLPRLRRLENRLQQQLVRDCVDADSGALALLLASMAAGIAQERVLL